MNKILKSAAFMTVPVMMACGVLAQADEWNKSTKITVDQAIEVPGAVLPPGTYVFKLLDSPSDRHVVQVFNEREDHVFASIIAIPNYRLTPTGKTVITFYEVPAGQPQPVRAWFYPGDNFGQEFVYPKERNLYVAQTTDTTTTTPAPAVAETPAPAPAPEVAQAEPAPAPTPIDVTPAPQPDVVAANEPPPSPLPAAPVMPQTGSNVPLFALLGLLTIGAALTLGAFSKRMG
jgi:LPXTG-motif cell wall-anchored protein